MPADTASAPAAISIDDLSALQQLFGAADIVKVIHNASFEQAVLGEVGLTIENIFDTLTESRKRRGQVGGGHSLLAVVRRELDRVLDKGPTSDWTRRPLSPAQEAYAAMDVDVLVDLYGAMAIGVSRASP